MSEKLRRTVLVGSSGVRVTEREGIASVFIVFITVVVVFDAAIESVGVRV